MTRVTPGQARLIVGGPIAAEIRVAVAEDVAAFTLAHGRPPGLAVVIIGRDAPSTVYLEQILRGCAKVGIDSHFAELEGEATESSIVARIRDLNEDPTVDGVIVQMPLPRTIRLRSVVDAIDPAKDIDGIHPLNAGLLRLGYDGFLPATAHAAVEILRRSGIEIAGKDAVVIGRSAVVGMPAAFLLVKEDARSRSATRARRILPVTFGGRTSWSWPRVGRAWSPGPCSSRAPSSSTSVSTWSMDASSATLTSHRRWTSRRPSRRSRAASGR